MIGIIMFLVAFTSNVMYHHTCQIGIVLIYVSLAWQIIYSLPCLLLLISLYFYSIMIVLK